MCSKDTDLFGSRRHTGHNSAIVLFTQLTAVLPIFADRPRFEEKKTHWHEKAKQTENNEFKGKFWRRGAGSNRRIKVLQTSPLPLGYRALAGLPLNFLLTDPNHPSQPG